MIVFRAQLDREDQHRYQLITVNTETLEIKIDKALPNETSIRIENDIFGELNGIPLSKDSVTALVADINRKSGAERLVVRTYIKSNPNKIYVDFAY